MPEPESPFFPSDPTTNGDHSNGHHTSADGADIQYHLTAYAAAEEWLPGGLAMLARYRRTLRWDRILELAAEIDIYPLDVERAVDAWLAAYPQNNEKADAGKYRSMVTTLAEITPAPVAWLWQPYIPLGKLTILEGDPETGKTWLSLVIAASITRGLPLPCPEHSPQINHAPGMVVLMQGEDGAADTLRPRFDAAGGDPERIHLLHGKQDTKTKRVEDVTIQDLDVIEATLAHIRPTLLVIDPLQAYLGAGVDMHRANQTRPLLSALGRLAEQYQCSVLCIRHLSKSRHDRTLYRGLGSIDFSAAARSVLLTGFDPDDPDENRRVLVHNKSSLAVRGTSLGYEINDAGFHWLGPSTITAAELLAPRRSEETGSELEEAIDFLTELLTAAPRPAKDVQKEAKHAGISLITLRRAKKQLTVRAWREGFATGQGRGQWIWGF